MVPTTFGIILGCASVGHFLGLDGPSAQIEPQIQRIDSTLLIKKKMGVTPLPNNQAGKGMMALLGALGRALAPKRPIKGVDGNNGNVLESAFPGLN